MFEDIGASKSQAAQASLGVTTNQKLSHEKQQKLQFYMYIFPKPIHNENTTAAAMREQCEYVGRSPCCLYAERKGIVYIQLIGILKKNALQVQLGLNDDVYAEKLDTYQGFFAWPLNAPMSSFYFNTFESISNRCNCFFY